MVAAMGEAPETLLFDLDGTLIDSALGIGRCVAHAMEALGEPIPDADALRRWIGPPLRTSFGPLLNDAQRTERAVELYRERFDEIGWSEHTIYPGIETALRALHAAGHHLAVVTAKNQPHAERIVAHLPFADLFEIVVGASYDGRLGEKPELIGVALDHLRQDPTRCWMVGDRHMDIDGARHHGMRCVGVLWGFGGAEELREATRLCARPDELPDVFAASAVGV
ncbi:MAG: HAD hydrolase-like protein [Proteobacteria bacterium]|nr:HAD hydrolase-like protein [Pseudomonadota bacterium]MBS0463034.1 HAD hydrolase-like protein [Pseudomonadota bacterium]MBS0465511.1 HAD hydrolase-like protein [Pseudomonadota bacterium]